MTATGEIVDGFGTDLATTVDASCSEGVSATDVFAALANEQRRDVLRALSERDIPVAVEALAADVAEDSGGAVERTHVSLVHIHLPRLDDLGLVEHDRERGEIVDVTDVDLSAVL